jgi:predicted outer membrane repeat protein
VDKDATGNNNGASWADAYNVIQDAVDNATSGDELWIAGGTYHRRTVFDNEVIAMVGGVNIFGGFVGTETSRDDRDWTANPTILDGESAVDHVVVAYRNARIDGFTITAGLADGSVNERNGGGMLINRHDTVVANCTFTGNSANNYGGAIYTYDGDFRPTIINCTFTGNSGWHGGAIYASSDSPIIIDCVFESNSGTGGAIRNGSPYASGCIFRKNGTWAVYSGHCNFYNCIFAGNKGGTGGACNIGDGSEIVNCTFTGNKGSQGGAIYSNGTTGFIKNCIFWGNTAPTDPDLYGGIPVSYCAIENGGTFADGGNNLTGQDPLFVTDGYWDDNGTPGDGNDDFWVNGDYHLRSSSPCKNVGTNADAPSNDLDGNPRPSGSGVDMGAYEYQE